jgi:hypothetical protein
MTSSKQRIVYGRLIRQRLACRLASMATAGSRAGEGRTSRPQSRAIDLWDIAGMAAAADPSPVGDVEFAFHGAASSNHTAGTATPRPVPQR